MIDQRHGAIAGAFEALSQSVETCWDCLSNGLSMWCRAPNGLRVERGEQRNDGGVGPRRTALDGVEDDSLRRYRVQVRRGPSVVAVGAEMISAESVDDDQEEVRG